MPRTCMICSHAERRAVDRALVLRVPFRSLAQRYDRSPHVKWAVVGRDVRVAQRVAEAGKAVPLSPTQHEPPDEEGVDAGDGGGEERRAWGPDALGDDGRRSGPGMASWRQ